MAESSIRSFRGLKRSTSSFDVVVVDVVVDVVVVIDVEAVIVVVVVVVVVVVATFVQNISF